MGENGTPTISIVQIFVKVIVLGIVLFCTCMLAAQVAKNSSEKMRRTYCRPIVAEAVRKYAADFETEEALKLSKNPEMIKILSSTKEEKGPWLTRTKETEQCFQKDIWNVKRVPGYQFDVTAP